MAVPGAALDLGTGLARPVLTSDAAPTRPEPGGALPPPGPAHRQAGDSDCDLPSKVGLAKGGAPGGNRGEMVLVVSRSPSWEHLGSQVKVRSSVSSAHEPQVWHHDSGKGEAALPMILLEQCN